MSVISIYLVIKLMHSRSHDLKEPTLYEKGCAVTQPFFFPNYD